MVHAQRHGVGCHSTSNTSTVHIFTPNTMLNSIWIAMLNDCVLDVSHHQRHFACLQSELNPNTDVSAKHAGSYSNTAS
jgi:hypothetical protein